MNWPRRLQRGWLYLRLTDIAALEHFTVVLGEWLIQNRGLDYAGADPMMLDLLRWHGAEEIEHRCLVVSTKMAMDYLEHSPAARAARESAGSADGRNQEQPDAAENETEKAEG